MGIELRVDDERTAELIAPLHHRDTALRVGAERALNTRLQGGCQVPIAAYAVLEESDRLWLRGLVGRADGSEILRAEGRAEAADFDALGTAVADDLLAQGAAELLAAAYG